MRCPHCRVHLREEETIGVEVPGVFDGVLYWQCPSCDGAIHRFPAEHPLRARAEGWMAKFGRPIADYPRPAAGPA